MRAKKTGTVCPDSLERDKQLFEYLLVVQLDENFELQCIHRFSWKQFLAARAWDKRMNAWYVPVSKVTLKKGEQLYPTSKNQAVHPVECGRGSATDSM